MSGIYIKGIEMPTEQTDVLIIAIQSDGSVFPVHIDEEMQNRAFPVPDHGRLIDTSAKVQTQLYDDQIEDWIDADMTVEEYLGYCFNEVPTIIPADKEGDG